MLFEKVQIKPIIRNTTINKMKTLEETGTFNNDSQNDKNDILESLDHINSTHQINPT